MTNALKRALRTFVQAFLGSVLTSGILSTVETDGVVDWSSLTKVGVSALAAGLIALVSWIHNALEDRDVVPQVLR